MVERHYKWKSVEVGVFRRGWVTLMLPANHCWCQKTSVIALSCGIKKNLKYLQFVTIHACDRQTDGQTDGQNYGSQDHASTAAHDAKTAANRAALFDSNMHQIVCRPGLCLRVHWGS